MISNWSDLNFWKSEEWSKIKEKIRGKKTCPEKKDIFRSLILTKLQDVKVVILGQDPYPTEGQANGLAFSVSPKHRGKLPKSLHNIYKELRDDVKCPWPQNGDLSRWASQGVLLINTYWTTEPKTPLAHQDYGWEKLTKEIVETVAIVNPNCVFILWGKEAQKMLPLIGSCPRVLSPHPSPLSAQKGFLGSKPFTKCNSLLAVNGKETIDWR